MYNRLKIKELNDFAKKKKKKKKKQTSTIMVERRQKKKKCKKQFRKPRSVTAQEQ